MINSFLNNEELERITCRKKARAQARMLKDMGIPYFLNGDGWPLVFRKNIFTETINKKPFKNKPDFKSAFCKRYNK